MRTKATRVGVVGLLIALAVAPTAQADRTVEGSGFGDVASIRLTGPDTPDGRLGASALDPEITAPSRIMGTLRVGRTVTGVPATFTEAPENVITGWLVAGEEVPGTSPTTLVLEQWMEGKNVQFFTAIDGPSGVMSKSDEGLINRAFDTSDTAATVSPRAGRYGLPRTTTVTVGRELSFGKGDVTVRIGTWSQTVTLVNGQVRIQLPKLRVGSHLLVASYLGDEETEPSSYAVKFTVLRAATSTKVASARVLRKGKKVVVSAETAFPKGVEKAGTARFVIKRGGKTVAKGTVRVTSSGATRFVAHGLARKGKYTVTVSYSGTSQAASSTGRKAFRVK